MTTQELVEQLQAQALTLPEKERLRLVVALSDSMGPGVEDDVAEGSSLSPAWQDEIRRRAEGIRNGTTKTIPAKEAFAAIRAKHAR